MASKSTSSTNGQTRNESSVEFENRHEHEQQRQRREEMIQLRRHAGCDAAPALQPRGQRGMEHGEDEVKRQRGD